MADYVYRRYGSEHVVCLHLSNLSRPFRLRDLGKAMGLPLAELQQLTKNITGIPSDGIRALLHRLPELKTIPCTSQSMPSFWTAVPLSMDFPGRLAPI